MSERFTPYEPDEVKKTPPETTLKSSEKVVASAQGHPTTEMQEANKGRENHVEKEPGTRRATASDAGQAPAAASTQPTDTPTPDPATTDDTKDAPQAAQRPIGDNPPLSKEDQATLDWVKQERKRREQEVQDDLKKWDERPKPAWYRDPDDPPLKAPPFDRRPMDQINDVPRPMTETPDPNRGRRSMQGHTDET